MFSHIVIGSNDIERSKGFYDALFDAVGAKPGRQDEKGVNYMHNGALFMVRPPRNGEAATNGNGSTIGFSIDSPRARESLAHAGVAAGGTSSKTRRASPRASALYLAYLRDPDGNKLCGLHRLPTE